MESQQKITSRPNIIRNRTPQAITGVTGTQVPHSLEKPTQDTLIDEQVTSDPILQTEPRKKRIVLLQGNLKAPQQYESTPQTVNNMIRTLKKQRSKVTVFDQDGADDEIDNKPHANSIVDYRGMKMTLQQRDEYMQMENQQIQKFKSQYYPAKFASKKNGIVVTYAANTHQGMVRNYNEDRVSIILNIIQPKFKKIEVWPRCSFFAIYDGHGGAQCADFLRDQLHQLIVKDPAFPQDPKTALGRAFHQAETDFLRTAHVESIGGEVQKSGSCAVAVLIVGEIAYIANTGDSRAVMCVNGGKNFVQLTQDHKPEDLAEKSRIESNGGKVYQNFSYIPDPTPSNLSGQQTLAGPFRVEPGRLSVSRTIGDIEAKDPRYGGNPNVVIPTPDVKCFKIQDSHDYIIMGCDGIFEKLTNKDIQRTVLSTATKPNQQSVHERSGLIIDNILNSCVEQKTLDNITSVLIGFKGLERIMDSKRLHDSIEMAFDWDQLELEVEEETLRLVQQFQKPLESVIEEASELETPASESTYGRKKLGGHNREQTSIMSSKRPSGCAPLEETVTTEEQLQQTVQADKKPENEQQNVEEQAGPVNVNKQMPQQNLQKFQTQLTGISSQFVEKKEEQRNSKENLNKQQPPIIKATGRSGSSNGRRTIVVTATNQSQQQIPVTTTNRHLQEIPKKQVFRKFSLNQAKATPQITNQLRPATPKRFAEKQIIAVQQPQKSSSSGNGNKTQILKKNELNFYDKSAWATTTQNFVQIVAPVPTLSFKSQRVHTDMSDEVVKRKLTKPLMPTQYKTPTAIQTLNPAAAMDIAPNRKSGSRNVPAHQRQSFGLNQNMQNSNSNVMQQSLVDSNKSWQSNMVQNTQKQKLHEQIVATQKQQRLTGLQLQSSRGAIGSILSNPQFSTTNTKLTQQYKTTAIGVSQTQLKESFY